MTTATAINTNAAAKTLFTGRTHNVGGRDGSARSSDGFVDVKMSAPHPAAENLFGAAWSACYMGAIELAARLGLRAAAADEVRAGRDAGAGHRRADQEPAAVQVGLARRDLRAHDVVGNLQTHRNSSLRPRRLALRLQLRFWL
mgnify:CR=1 FL=1